MRTNQIEIYRNRILDVCKKSINDETFFEKSLFEIARIAKVSRMTIYRHFLNKNEIIKKLLINESLKKENDYIIKKILSCKNINNISFKFIQGGYHKSLMMWIKSQWSRSPESVAYELEKVILSLI